MGDQQEFGIHLGNWQIQCGLRIAIEDTVGELAICKVGSWGYSSTFGVDYITVYYVLYTVIENGLKEFIHTGYPLIHIPLLF